MWLTNILLGSMLLCFLVGVQSKSDWAQMLVRFRQDVIALRPKVVVVLAGTMTLPVSRGR